MESAWANTMFQDIADGLTDSLTVDADGGMTGPFKHFDGGPNTPAITFDSDTSTGFYRNAVTGKIHYVRQGVDLGALNEGQVKARYIYYITDYFVEPIALEPPQFAPIIDLPAGAHQLTVTAPMFVQAWPSGSYADRDYTNKVLVSVESTGSGSAYLSSATKGNTNITPIAPYGANTGDLQNLSNAANTFDNSTLVLEVSQLYGVSAGNENTDSGMVLCVDMIVQTSAPATVSLGVSTTLTSTGLFAIGNKNWPNPPNAGNSPEWGAEFIHTILQAGEVLNA